MCGIVGVLSNSNKQVLAKEEFFKEAIYADTLRGKDSTGMFTVTGTSNISILKRALPGYDFVELAQFDRLRRGTQGQRVVVGHNRKTTRGATNAVNAHPFDYDHITMVHNGTLTDYITPLDCGNKFDVDSEALTWGVAKYGYKEVFNKIAGAFACVWYDSNDKVTRIIRNAERPLSFATVKDDDTVLIASESLLIAWLASRNSLQLDKIYTPEVGQVVSFPVNNPTKWTAEKIELRQLVVVSNSPWTGEDYYDKKSRHNRGSANTHNKHITSTSTALTSHGLSIGKVITFLGGSFNPYQPKGPFGKLTGLWDGLDGKRKEAVVVEVSGFNGIAANGLSGTDCEGEMLLGEVCGIQVGDKPTNDVIIVKATTLRVADEDEDTPSETYLGPQGKPISFQQMVEACKGGCVCCKLPIKAVDYPTVSFTSGYLGEGPVCENCEPFALAGDVGMRNSI